MYFVICLTFALLSNVQAQYYDDYGEIDLECRADSHQVLYESQRRVLPSLPQEQSPDQGSLCDSLNLLTGWYRFALDGMAANFASECVMPKQCGTSSPIWLRAKQNDSIVTYDDRPTLPAKDEKKMIMACVSVESDCCAHTIPIQVRNCGEFFVYFLWIPSYVRKMHSCPSFCAENKAATPRIGRDTEVAYGFALPRVISTDVRNTGAFQLRCVFEKPPRVEIANKASYLVSWMLLPTTGGIKELLKTEETTETFSMINLMKIDVTVTCSVKVVDKADPGSVLIPSVESAEFYLGLQFEPSHVTLGEGEIQKIVVTSSVPLPCRSEMPDCQMSIFLALRDSVRVDNLPPNVLMVSSCSVAVTRSDCREGICGRGQFEIAGIQDFTEDGDRETYIESVPLLSLDVLWSNYNPPGIRVSVQNLPTAQCHSVMDPHIATLDGALRELHMTGTFVLYKSLKRTFEVHSRVWDKCGEQNNTVSAWCHCGVAAREGDDVILIDMCDGGELTNGAILPRIEIVSELPLAVGTHIIQSNQGKKTTVFFPSGAFLRVDAEEWGLGITVQAPSIDYGATDGLCGTFDGSKENDTVSAVNEWRLAAKESLFDRLPTNKSPIPELKPIYCLCGEIGEGCMFQQPISRPNLFNGVDKTVEYIINAQQNFKEQSFGHSQEGGYASMMANTDQGRTFIGPAATQRFSNREGTFHHYSHNNRMRRSTTNVQELSHKQTRKSRRRKRQTAHRYNAPQSNLYPPLPHRPVHDDPWTYNNDYRNFQNQWSQNAQTTIKKPTYGHDERYQPAGQEKNSARLSGETGKVPGLMSSAYGAQYPQHSNNYASGKQRGQQYNTPYYPQQQFSAYNYGAADTLPRSNYRQFQAPQNIQFGSANDGRQVTNGGFADEKNRKTMKATETVNTQQRRLTHNSDSYVNSMNYQNQPVKEHGYLNRINDRNYHQPVVHEVPRKQYQYVPLYEMPQNKHQSLTSSYRNAGDDYGVANGRQQQHLGIMSMGSNSNDAGFQPQHSFLRLQSDQPVSGLELNPSSDTTKLVVAQQAGNYLQQTHPKRNATQIASYQPRRSYVFLEDLFPKDSLKTDMTWPNFKGWTKISVTNKCENLIREMDIVQTCREVLSESLIQNVINICISDVHGKGDWIWAKRTRSLLENMCEENLIKTSSMWSKGLDGTLTAPQRILDSLNCPKACSNHGRCTTQGCECSAGFSGEDCSKEIGGADKEMSTVNGKAMTTETTTFPKVDHQTTSTSAAVITTSTPTTTTTKSPEVYATTATTIASTAVTYASTRLAEHTTAERSLTTAEDEKTTVLATHSTRISPIEKLTSLSTESLVITTRGDDKTVSDTTTTVEKAEPLLLTGAENDGECYITRSSCDNIVINAVGLNRGYPDSSPFKSVKCIVATLVPGSLPPPGVSYAGTVENEGQVRCTLPALTFAIMASEIRYDIKVVDGERESNSIEAVVYMGYGEQDPCRSAGNKPHVMENQKTLSAFEGEEFIYQLTAVDPEDQFVYFELENAAESDVYMTPIGQVEWAVPIGGDATTKKISFTMQDQCGLTTRETVQVTILPCLCENGGMCVPDLRHAPGLGAYECRCMRGYTGKFCNETGAECLPGFTGVNCLEDIDECASEPCFPGIACNNVIGSFFCDMCPEGTFGDGMFCTDDYGDYLPEEEEGPATNMNQLPPSDKETTAVAKTTDTQTTTDIDETIQEDDFHTEQSLLIPSIVKITSEPERALAMTISLQQATTEVTTKSQTTFPTTQKRNDLITSTVVTSKKVKTTSSIQDATTVKYTTSPTTVERTTKHDATTTADRSTPKSTSVKSTTPEAEELTTSDDATTPPKARTTVLTTLETTASLETTTPLQTTATDRITTKHETTTMAEKSTSTTAQTTPSSTVLHRSSRPSTSAVKFTESGLGRLTTTAPEHTTTAEASATPKRASSTTGKVSSTTTSTTTTTSKPPIRLTTKKPWRPYRPRMKVRRCKKTNGKKICKLVKKIPGSHRIKQRPNFATIGGKPMKYYVKQRDGKRVRYTYRDCIKQCGSRGKCMANGMCRCKPEYAGRFCERSACNDLCKNDGVCVSRNKCKCTDGYSGNLCEDFTCRLSCQNNGKCVGPDHCECPKGFEGETCEVPVCEPECENGGQCKENNLCSCQSGYMGRRCQQAVCRPGCLNGGTCTRKDVCACPPSFLGNRCQISVCIPTCGHGGRCLKNNVCMCRKGWKGTHCRAPICIDKCAHGGKCIAPNKCKCKNGWSGSSCRTGHCERRCRHGARCVRPNLCKCPYGPRGKGCRLKLRFGRKPSSVFGRL